MGIKYHINKTFRVLNYGFAGFFSSFGHNTSLCDVPKPKSGISVIFVNFVNLNLTDIFTEDLNFHFRFFYLILTKIREFYLPI